LVMSDPQATDGIARYSSLDEALKYDPHARMELDQSGLPTLLPSIVVFRNADQRDSIGGADARGNYKANRVTGLGRFSFDLAMSKSIEFMEGKRFELRVDAQNILNHPTPSGGAPTLSNGGRVASTSNPSTLSISNSTGFGRLANKGGHRTFQAKLSLRF